MESQFQAVGVQLKGATIVIDDRNLRQMLVNWNIYHIHIYKKKSELIYGSRPDILAARNREEAPRNGEEAPVC